ncbi:unnamed protein product, partial [Discosporangium mesarthrocarpum]
IHDALRDCVDLSVALPAGTEDDQLFVQFLNTWVQRVRALRVGELALAPGGWVRPDGSGQAVMFVVTRVAEGEDRYTLSVVNPWGEGAEYHAKSADPAKGKV